MNVIQENTPTVANQVSKQDGQEGSVVPIVTQRELKVTVEKDLVSQAEEEEMEALLGTYVYSMQFLASNVKFPAIYIM